MPRPTYAVVAQRDWLLEHFTADVDVCREHRVAADVHVGCEKLEKACRCWRCGELVPFERLCPDRIDTRYGTRRSNLRPACARCAGRG